MSHIKAHRNSVVVIEPNLRFGIIHQNMQLLDNPNLWHKFIIFNTQKLERDVVLKAILDHVYPFDFIPVNFRKNHANSYFLARNCKEAIEKLCNDNLRIPGTLFGSFSKPFKVQIVLKFSSTNEFKIDVHNNIFIVLNKNFDTTTKTLYLASFHKNAELLEYCPLSQSKIMHYVLHLAKHLQPTKIVLSNNDLKNISQLAALTGLNITSIDLSQNLLNDKSVLEELKSLKYLTEVSLFGNPICEKFDAASYISMVKQVCPKIIKLDGVNIMASGLPVFKRNFLCDLSSFDLVNQFLEHFFTLYDSRNRQIMEGLYHKNAMFSMTSFYNSFQLSSSQSDLQIYKNYSRNLKKLADVSRHSQFLFRGIREIIDILQKLPFTEHDPYSFMVDLVYHTEKCSIIVVNGIFREFPENLLLQDRILGFTRNFVLECNDVGEYCIVNEQLHVYNALSAQETSAFQISKQVSDNSIPPPENPEQRNQLMESVKLITNLNSEWATKLLGECQFDLKKTLGLFVDLYKVDKIPANGFQRDK